MPHRSIVRISENRNISRAGNSCLALFLYFMVLIIFHKYWIIINATFFGLIISGSVVIYFLKAASEQDSNENSETSDSESSSDSDEEIICQAEVVLEIPPPSYDNLEKMKASTSHIHIQQSI